MKRNLLTILFIVVFSLIKAQVLVQWSNANFAPVISNNNVNSQSIGKTVGLESMSWSETFFSSSLWPKPTYTNPYTSSADEKKYLQFEISPKGDNKIEVSNFNFTYRSQGNDGKFYVKYSLNSDFSQAQTLSNPITISDGSWHALSLTDFSKLPSKTIPAGKTLYIRIYVYDTNNNFHLKFDSAKKEGPSISGVVKMQLPTAPVTNDDTAKTSKNNEVSIDVLNNDLFEGAVTLTIPQVAKNGITTITDKNQIIYTPKADFVGEDSFYYVASNNVGDSKFTKVTVTVTNDVNINLIRWDQNDFSGTVFNNSILKTNIKANNVGLKTDSWETPIYYISDVNGNTPIDYNKYIEFTVKNSSNIKNVKLSDFGFSYRGTNDAIYTIQYSKDPAFKTDVKVLADAIKTDATYASKSFSFNDITLKANEALYIRLYVYKTNGQFVIQYQNQQLGPLVTGVVYNNYITTWTSALAWDNGTPDAYKTAVVEGVYNTSKYGDFEAGELIVKTTGKLSIDKDNFVKVYNKITNEGDANSIIVESDADLLQVNNAVNIGKITVKRLTRLPRKGYNYWSSPVKGQNVYNFSDGYNQAAPPVNPQGTPWNAFFVYNEANDYFTSNIPNEIKIDATSEFQIGRGYAIRGKNSFPNVLTQESPEAAFQFVGVPNNGDIQTQNMKWTNADHGYNMIGNPYPSNIDMDMFFTVNQDNVEPVAYFWTNNDMSIINQQGSKYEGNNYAIYNKVGGIPATFSGLNKGKPKQAAKVGQGFIVRAKSAGKNKALIFNNAMRTNDDGIFFNNKAAQKDRFWINLKSPSEINNEILIAYLPNATNTFDSDLDAELLAVGQDAIWTKEGSLQLGIQARNAAQIEDDVVPVGVKFSEKGNYTISITDREGKFDGVQTVYLKDKVTSTITEISKEDYTFYAEEGTEDNRFELIYQAEKVLSTDNISKNNISIYQQNQNVIVKSQDQLQNVEIYDMLGRLMTSKNVKAKEVTLDISSYNAGMYILKAKTATTTVTKKLLK